jgi:endonuclease/exonuclease/phosphatase family metal-dependent hydrolase
MVWVLAFGLVPLRAGTFSVATFNLEGYLVTASESRPAKPEASRAKVQETLRRLNADVVALQEIGGLESLKELRARLGQQGMDYPHWDLVQGYDPSIQVGVLSRFPIVARRPHADEGFLLRGRRFRTTRGFVEVDILVPPSYRFTLMAAHLKSRREVGEGAQDEIREREARILRQLVDQRLRADPRANLIVLGDFNDVKDSLPVRTLLGRGKTALVDTRPAERNGEEPLGNSLRRIVWTHYYAKEDTYARVDYILLSPGMAREWKRDGTHVLALPNWGVASDHRPLLATFGAKDE